MRENIKLLKIRYKDRDTNAVLTENTVKYPDSYRTKHRIKPKGLIHRYDDRIHDGHSNVLKMHQAPTAIKENPASKKPPLETKHPCHRSKTMAPIARPISNNFALINSNLNEIENLLKNPKTTQEINLDLKKGLHDWSLWRAKFNETLIKSCFTPAKLKKSIQTHNDLRLKSQSYIEPSFVHYSSYYGEDTNLDPESFMFYGLPRVRITPKPTLAEEESDQTIDTTDSAQFKKKSHNIVTGVSVKEKIKVFENSEKKNSLTRKLSAPDSNDFIETKHIYRHEPDNKLIMMAMPSQETKEVLKAVDGDIIFTNKSVQKGVEDSPEKVNCLGKSKPKIDEDKKHKNYFMPLKNILLPKTDTIKAAAVAAVQAAFTETKPKKSESGTGTVRRRKRDTKSRKVKTEKPKSKTCKRKQQSTRTRNRKSRNFNMFNPGNYQTYPTRKSPFFITNNTAQNIEYFTNHILESSVDVEKIDRDIIDLLSSSSSSILTLESAESNSKHKSKTVRDRTRRHFDRKQKQKSQVKISFTDNFQNLHKSKNLKTKQSISSRESMPPPPPVPPPPPPEIENIPKRRSSDVSKLSIPMVQPPPPQVPPPSLNRYLEGEGLATETIVAVSRESASGKKVGLRRMKVTEEKIEMESVEIIKQDGEMPKLKSVIEKEKYPNLFKLPRLRYQPNSQLDSSMISTTTVSNTRTRPKTSKEILQEISRLTNGTTPNTNKFNSTFHNSDLDSTILSSNSKFIRK